MITIGEGQDSKGDDGEAGNQVERIDTVHEWLSVAEVVKPSLPACV